jgi:hypothetical protein
MFFQFFLISFFSLFLSSCGLEPMFKNKSDDPIMKSCKLTLKIDQNGYTSFNLQNRLNQRKGLIEARLKADSTLYVKITEEFTAVNVVDARVSNRNNGRIAVDLKLTYVDHITGKPEQKETRLDCISSYDLDQEEQFAAEQAKESVRNRLINNLTDEIIRETLYLIG